MRREKLIKYLAILHIFVGIEIFLFWLGFFSETIFPKELLASRIKNFSGYYAWESAFVLPDSVMAIAMIVGGFRLLRNHGDYFARTLLLSASGAAIFLGLLDFHYDLCNGMYGLGHFFSYILLAIGTLLPPFGFLSIYIIHNHRIKEVDDSKAVQAVSR